MPVPGGQGKPAPGAENLWIITGKTPTFATPIKSSFIEWIWECAAGARYHQKNLKKWPKKFQALSSCK
jgi:hypothetical protein